MEVALSNTEAEYICISQALRNTIPLMNLLKQIQQKMDQAVHQATLNVRFTLFKDNSGALDIARTPKMRPRTKHVNKIYHHFQEYICCHLIHIEFVSTQDQVADIFTKPLPLALFRKYLMKL